MTCLLELRQMNEDTNYLVRVVIQDRMLSGAEGDPARGESGSTRGAAVSPGPWLVLAQSRPPRAPSALCTWPKDDEEEKEEGREEAVGDVQRPKQGGRPPGHIQTRRERAELNVKRDGQLPSVRLCHFVSSA